MRLPKLNDRTIKQLRDPQRRAVVLAQLRKSLTQPIRSRHTATMPIFVLGLQRSGTNMLINVLHLRSDTQVFSEHRNNVAYYRYMLRDLDVVDRLVRDSWAPYICFKPIADSHRVHELMARFPSGRFVWIYRNYADVANSSLRAFPHATRAIRLVCRDEEGGGWFANGVSAASREVLRKLATRDLSEFDYACLIWWARNRIFIENNLFEHDRVLAVRYERLVASPAEVFERLLDALGLEQRNDALRYVHASSVRKHAAPPLDPEVERLCDDLLEELNRHTI